MRLYEGNILTCDKENRIEMCIRDSLCRGRDRIIPHDVIVDLLCGKCSKLIAAVIHNFLFFHIILHSADAVRRYDSRVLPAFIRRLRRPAFRR